MRPENDIKRFIDKAAAGTHPTTDKAVLGALLAAHTKARDETSVGTTPRLGSTVMRNPFIKFAAAVAIIGAVALGLFEFRSTGGKSGIAWAEVAQKVQASPCVVFRSQVTDTNPHAINGDYVMNYLSKARSRVDSYRGGQIFQTNFGDYTTHVLVLVRHDHKAYLKVTDPNIRRQGDLSDPRLRVQRFIGCEHRKLGERMIDGVLCEGIETRDLAFLEGDYPTDSVTAQLWVRVDTGYPALIQVEIVRDKGNIRITVTEDEFQWDKELDENLFVPDVPHGYVSIDPP
jgi:hypothetical protein